MTPFGTLKSMTGYGRAAVLATEGRFEVEIQSVNRRFLEINLSLPKSFFRFENEIRKWLHEKIARGQVNVYVRFKTASDATEIGVDLGKVKALKEAWGKIASAAGTKEEPTLRLYESALQYEEKGVEGEEPLKQALFEAMEALDHVRRNEGNLLLQDFQMRLEILGSLIGKIEKESVGATENYRQKLSSRLSDLFSEQSDHEEKVLREVALFAEKIDITEELVRFKTHLNVFLEALQRPLKDPADAKGKRLEFLLQELGREINTIGSKTQSGTVSSLVIDVKCELEKMREQVQNIE